MFIDEALIIASSGKGGDGIVHFRREKYVPRGGPDGGDGGHGGDVILKVNPHLNTLSSFRYKEKFIAPSGGNGGPSNRTGKSAENLIVPVPPGTIIYDAETNEVLGDLVDDSQELVVCPGGRGGRGNARYASARNQAPRIAEKGEPGIERRLRLELKLLADIGIVGAPNAGKSTFLAVVTNAKPKIAPYPFTTIEPNLGVAELDNETSLVLADIPGLIEGAHAGVGLGHSFLRHIQRTRVLIHLLDGMSENPVLDYAQINTELALFDPDLAHKPQIVALNKIDLPDVQDKWTEILKQFKKKGISPIAISAVTGENVRQVLFMAAQRLADTPRVSAVEIPIYRPDVDPQAFEIQRTTEGWRVVGVAIERAAKMTYWEYEQSARRFQKILQTLGIEAALRSAGIQQGDSVFIGDFELEWQD
jgi:GTPase